MEAAWHNSGDVPNCIHAIGNYGNMNKALARCTLIATVTFVTCRYLCPYAQQALSNCTSSGQQTLIFTTISLLLALTFSEAVGEEWREVRGDCLLPVLPVVRGDPTGEEWLETRENFG